MNVKTNPPPSWRVQQYRDGDDVQVLSVEPEDKQIKQDKVVLRSLPAHLDEETETSQELFEEVLYSDKALPREYRASVKPLSAVEALKDPQKAWPGSEVRTLVSQGPLNNRINLTIVGDGYTVEEKERFFEDARRMTDDMFQGQTFASYLPLFNVHAVFVPSNESGLSDAEEKDTALKLYRSPEGSKRAIMPGDRRACEKAIALAPATDYPILIANDNYYGGLGGRYAITTRSPESGTMVLRHELGHNFGNVGEEYDGGQVYSGANHSRTADVPWKHWLEGELKPENGKALVGDYPWQNLAEGPVSYSFDVPENPEGKPSKVDVHLSAVGWDTPVDVEILLDGKPLLYNGLFTDDRSFFKPLEPPTLEPGRHTITFQEKINDGDNVLGSLRINLYDADYDFTPGKVGAFPSFDAYERMAGYRPTHGDCLMRNMRSTEFCPVDRENMWHKFMSRINLVDGVDVSTNSDGHQEVSVRTPPLDGMGVRWFQVDEEGNEQELLQHANQRKFQPEQGGKYRVKVEFRTPEVRVYNSDFEGQMDFRVCPA
ncbi:hypothetical protein DYH09_19360 [bacterium CPR1]|nr:hypothetical protein [bacterium CPR1]